MPGLSHALVPAQESKRWSFGRLLLLPVIQKDLFLGPKKSRKIRHANTDLPVAFFRKHYAQLPDRNRCDELGLLTRQLCGSDRVCRPEFSIIQKD